MHDPQAFAPQSSVTRGGPFCDDGGEPPDNGRFPIYSGHFGLNGRPFSLLPDPNFVFWSAVHARAYAMLEDGLATFAPIIMITGEIGAGKTTLVRHLLNTAGTNLRIGLVSNAIAGRGSLLHWALLSLQEPLEGRIPHVQRFSHFEMLLRGEKARGRHTVMIIDEAQNLSVKMLEELRCLSNLNDESDELLQIVLTGQPELNRTIDRPSMLQFAQRVSARFHLTGMPAEAVEQYVAHRLRVAGADRQIFSPAACDLVYSVSRGLPRVINQICDYALVYAFADDRATVDADLIRQVLVDRKTPFPTASAMPAGL